MSPRIAAAADLDAATTTLQPTSQAAATATSSTSEGEHHLRAQPYLSSSSLGGLGSQAQRRTTCHGNDQICGIISRKKPFGRVSDRFRVSDGRRTHIPPFLSQANQRWPIRRVCPMRWWRRCSPCPLRPRYLRRPSPRHRLVVLEVEEEGQGPPRRRQQVVPNGSGGGMRP